MAAGLLQKALAGVKRQKEKKQKMPNALALAIEEFEKAESAEDKAEALRGFIELAQLEKE